MGQTRETPWHVEYHLGNPNMARVVGPKFRAMPECEGGGWYTDPETARLIAAAPIPQDLYNSEINFTISTFWDGGFEVMLGDTLNGFKCDAALDTYVEALEWLRDRAIEHFPNSEFAKAYRAALAKAKAKAEG